MFSPPDVLLAGLGVTTTIEWRHHAYLSINRGRHSNTRRHTYDPPRSSTFPFDIEETSSSMTTVEQPTPNPPVLKPSTKLRRLVAPAMPTPNQTERDENGRSLAGRKKPLKINLDLALVRPCSTPPSTKQTYYTIIIIHLISSHSLIHLTTTATIILQYRARQVRIQANRATINSEQSRLNREAEAALRKCLEMDPEDGRAYVILGKMLVIQRRYDEAEALYEAGSAATGGSNAHIWTAWAYLAGRRSNPSLARKLYDAAIVASPTHAAAYHGWGLLEKAEGRFLQARDIWIKGIQAIGSNANPYLYQSLAVLASELEKPDEARKWFRAGTKTVAGSGSHALWHAWALMEQRLRTDPEAVRALYRRGLQTSPRSRYIFLSWALWEKSQGNIEAARKLFRTGSHLNRRDPALPQAWALMEEEQGFIEQARTLFRRASKADPLHLYVWQAWGCMEQRAKNIDAARELFQQGIWAAPSREKDVSLIFQAWAVLEKDAENIGLARELFKCAVRADPKSEPSWLAWADMEEALGRFERANELRGFNMQERQEVVMPANFTTLPASSRESQKLLKPLFDQLAKWFQRYEASLEGDDGASGGRKSDEERSSASNAVRSGDGPGLRTLLDMNSEENQDQYSGV